MVGGWSPSRDTVPMVVSASCQSDAVTEIATKPSDVLNDRSARQTHCNKPQATTIC